MALNRFLVNAMRNGKFRVMFSAIAANTLYIAAGCNLSYASPAVPNINDNRNAFHVNDNEQSWIGSLFFLGYAIGAIVCGSICDYFGRKLTMIFTSAFSIIGFTIVSAATNVQTMYAGLFITGFSSAISTTAAVLYTAEISTPDNRGILLSLFSTLSSVGQVIVYVAGSYLPWNWLAIFAAALYAYPPFILVFLPESPRWFMLKGNKEAAAHGLGWFRGQNADIEEELEIIEQSMINAPKGISAFKDLSKWQHAKVLAICFILYLVQAFCGNFVIVVFTVTIFQLTKVNIDPNLQSVVMALFAVMGSVLCLFLIERCGRRPLLLYSTIFTVVGTTLVAAFFQIQDMNSDYATKYLFWLPMVGLSLASFMYSVGLNAVPWVFACEMFPTNTRGLVQTVSNVSSTLAQFVVVQTFASIESVIGTSGAFWFYTACGAAGIVFIVFVVKEPKKQILE